MGVLLTSILGLVAATFTTVWSVGGAAALKRRTIRQELDLIERLPEGTEREMLRRRTSNLVALYSLPRGPYKASLPRLVLVLTGFVLVEIAFVVSSLAVLSLSTDDQGKADIASFWWPLGMTFGVGAGIAFGGGVAFLIIWLRELTRVLRLRQALSVDPRNEVTRRLLGLTWVVPGDPPNDDDEGPRAPVLSPTNPSVPPAQVS